jgi:hypothetical protein
VVLPVNLLTEATVITVVVPGRRRVALGLLDAKCQSVGAMGTLLAAVVAPPPPPPVMGMSQPTRPNTDDRLQQS